MLEKKIIEHMGPATVAAFVDLGFVETTPLSFTKKGRRYIKARSKERADSILRIAIKNSETYGTMTGD